MSSKPHILMRIESSRESGRQLITGVADYARTFGPWHFHWEPQGLNSMERSADRVRYDGVLTRDVTELQSFINAGTPVVAFAYSKRSVSGTGFVKTDDHAVAEKVANHFIQRGFKRFAFCGYAGLPWSVGRGESFVEVLATAGFSADVYWTHPSSGGDTEDRATIRWLKALPRPVGLMAANDDLGRKVVQLCHDAGLRVPDDCAIVGVDNDPCVCGLSNPPLSSVGIDQYRSGYRAAALLDEMMKGRVPDDRIITANAGELVVRQSSDLIAIDDVALAKAIRFIKSNVRLPLTVDEVAGASGVYRRGLERRFAKHLSCSVQEYCRAARAHYLEKVLRESDQSLEKIAEHCGFSQASHLTRFFSRVRGETPSNFRKRTSERTLGREVSQIGN